MPLSKEPRERERARDQQECDTAACVHMLPDAAVYRRSRRACKVTTNDKHGKHEIRKCWSVPTQEELERSLRCVFIDLSGILSILGTPERFRGLENVA